MVKVYWLMIEDMYPWVMLLGDDKSDDRLMVSSMINGADEG
jgi:hypothetical protein